MRTNAIWNLAGVVLPTLIGLWTIPALIHNLGPIRFGVLSLCWTIVGFLGLMDLGLSRALTQVLATHAQKGIPETRSAGLAVLSLIFLFFLGLIWAWALFVNARLIAEYLFLVDQSSISDVESGLIWLSYSIPVAMVASGLIGILESKQSFSAVNSVRIFLGVGAFIAPLCVSYYSNQLDLIISSLFAVRFLALFLYAGCTLAMMPELLKPSAPSKMDIVGVFRFSGWLMVSNLVGPFLTYIDRFFISRILGPVALTYYSVPADIMMRFTVLPLAIFNATFPALSKEQTSKSGVVNSLISEAAKSLFLFWLPLLLAISLFANIWLPLWIGEDVAQFSMVIVHFFSLGVFINGCALLPYTVLQSEGRSDITAALHLGELPVHVTVLIMAINHYGVKGAAIAWVIRVTIDAALLYLIACKRNAVAQESLRYASVLSGVGGLILLAAPSIESTTMKTLILMASIVFVVASRHHRWVAEHPAPQNRV